MHTMSVSAELIKKKSRRIVEKNKDLNLGQIFCQTKVTLCQIIWKDVFIMMKLWCHQFEDVFKMNMLRCHCYEDVTLIKMLKCH